MLSRAVDLSDATPETALDYAEYLLADGKLLPAERTLMASLERHPNDIRLLERLGNIYVLLEDWPQLEDIISTLEARNDVPGQELSKDLQMRQLASRNSTGDFGEFLESVAAEDPDNFDVQAALIRREFSEGNSEAALKRAQDLVERLPNMPEPQLILASILTARGDLETAGSLLHELQREFPQDARAYLLQYTNEIIKEDPIAAMAALDKGLEAVPGAPRLLWAKGGRLEAIGDYEGAIKAYELWLESDPDSLIAANNLASHSNP